MAIEESFVAWYANEHPRLLAALRTLCGDVDLARDIADEALARTLARWDRVSRMDSPGAWTYRVAVNLLRRRMRRQASERRLVEGLAPPAGLQARDVELWDVVRLLPTRQRMAVVLRYVADLPEHEIAAVMGISRSGVASTLQLAHRRLKYLLTNEHTHDVRDPNA
jgi:RNA polymerase sigma factor (sigma-70 family)